MAARTTGRQHPSPRLLRVATYVRPLFVLEVVFWGTATLVAALFILLVVSFAALDNTYVLPRLIMCGVALLYVVCIWLAMRHDRPTLAAWMLIILYAALTSILLIFWSIHSQIGILTAGFVILLAGVILGARYIIPVGVGVIVLLLLVFLLNATGIVVPDHDWANRWPAITDVVSYGLILAIFALVSWLSRRQIEQALQTALAAEAALANEKRLLAVRLEEKTQHLQAVQLEEMGQLYRFIELGQLSSVVLHELAGHLATLTLDMDDIEQRNHRSQAVRRAKESISYLESTIDKARQQLYESRRPEVINVATAISEALGSLEDKAATAQVTLDTEAPVQRVIPRVLGDKLRLSQVVTVIVTNAIEAYQHKKQPPHPSRVVVSIDATPDTVIIRVCDWGVGIRQPVRDHLFEPLRSRKTNGMGIGLFIAQKIVTTHFKGTLGLDPRTDRTEFIIELPRYHKESSRVAQ